MKKVECPLISTTARSRPDGRVVRAGRYHHLSLGAISPVGRVNPARSTSCEFAIDTQVRETLA